MPSLLRQTVALAAFAGLLFSASRAEAQRWGTLGRERTGDLVWLATFPRMRVPLALSQEQIDELARISRERGTELRALYEKAGLMRGQIYGVLLAEPDNLTDETRLMKIRETQKKLLEIGMKNNEIYMPRIRNVLTTDQYQRVKQVAWQSAGYIALTDPEIVEALKLTEAQQEKFGALVEEKLLSTWKEMSAARTSGKAPVGGQAAAFKEKHKDYTMRAIDLLTDDQRKRLTELTGEPFDLDQLDR